MLRLPWQLNHIIYYQYWACQNFQTFAKNRGLISSTVRKVRGPYMLLWFLIVRNGPKSRVELPKDSKRQVFIDCVKSFLVYPNISALQRLKNTFVAAALTFAPASVTVALLKVLVAM